MISPLEIQRGSILSHEGKAKKVKAVSELIMFEDAKAWIGGSMIEGEPISGPWLEHLGFQKEEDGAFYRQFELLNWSVRIINTGLYSAEWIIFSGFQNQWNELRVIHYLHELQLLFFALSGEHLKVPKFK
jgi:hypothetical protein